uniref:Uncharacterized protein n=1 Tax=Nymphaea colorata TaxID=210225 RepID=A0A5K0YFP5_9MAGN|nr:unnamed protein product [Nymphaea colorata]
MEDGQRQSNRIFGKQAQGGEQARRRRAASNCELRWCTQATSGGGARQATAGGGGMMSCVGGGT